MGSSNYILCYTREPQDDMIYAKRLAYSMHLAYSKDGVQYEALNHNSGVLFAKATSNENGTLNAKSLKRPYIFSLPDGSYGVVAVRTTADGDDDEESRGKVLFFTTKDLLQYEEVGLIDLQTDLYVRDVICIPDSDKRKHILYWKGSDERWYRNEADDLYSLKTSTGPVSSEAVELPRVTTDIEGIVPRNVIAVPEHIGTRLKYKLSTPYHVSNEMPSEVRVSSPEELKKVKVKAVYNDGTTAMKSVDWDVRGVSWDKPGEYTVSGTIIQHHFPFPVAVNRADPCIAKWKGKYYFVATNDADGNKSIYIRVADSIPEIVHAEEHLILDAVTYPHVGNLLWAPELHAIGDDLYIFHAATPGEFLHEECHVMKLKRGGDPIRREDWSEPRRVVKKDGSYLCEAGKTISLDMTLFEWENEYYVVWSERQFVPVDLGAWLYIAKVNPEEPWKLTTDPVLLSKPEYGWANNHTFVDEGPFALKRGSKLFLTFSSALVDATYVVGLLTAEAGSDLLDPKSWTKTNYPLLTSRSVPGQYGPGHNAYVIDDEGVVWNTYHARPGVNGPRSTGIRRVHFDIDGYPVLDLTEERDVNPSLKQVTTKLIVG